MDELRAAVHHQLASVVGHSYVRKSLFDHLVDCRSGDCEVVVVARGGSHRGPDICFPPKYEIKKIAKINSSS